MDNYLLELASRLLGRDLFHWKRVRNGCYATRHERKMFYLKSSFDNPDCWDLSLLDLTDESKGTLHLLILENKFNEIPFEDAGRKIIEYLNAGSHKIPLRNI